MVDAVSLRTEVDKLSKLAVLNILLVAISYLLVSKFQLLYLGCLMMLGSVVFVSWASKFSDRQALLRFAFVMMALSILPFIQHNVLVGIYLVTYGLVPLVWHTVSNRTSGGGRQT